MNVWEVVFQLHWDNMPEGEFDELDEERVTVVAADYNSALEEARLVALTETWYDDEEEKMYFATDARLIGITKGQGVDAIARSLATK